MNTLGYEFLRTAMDLPVFAVARPARVAPVTRVIAITDGLQIPSQGPPAAGIPWNTCCLPSSMRESICRCSPRRSP